MNRQDEYVFTHYTEIAEAKHFDVRGMQTETALSILRFVGATVGKLFKRSPNGKGERVFDRM